MNRAMLRPRLLLALLCLLVAKPAISADDWTNTQLLSGRLSARVPAGTKEEFVPYDIMEAPPSKEVRARFFTQIDGKRLMFMPTELFQRTSSPLQAHADRFARATEERVGGVPFSRSWIQSIGRLNVLQLSPQRPAPAGGAFLMSNAVVPMQDGTLIEMPFFVDDVDAAKNPRIVSAVQEILSSLEAGPRALRSGPKTKVEGSRITLDLPENATAYAENAPDFTVCRVRMLVDPGSRPELLIIYIGNHPQRASAPDSAKTVAGHAFGRETTWRTWETANDTSRAEAFLRDFQTAGWTAHLLIHATQESARDALMRIADTSTVE